MNMVGENVRQKTAAVCIFEDAALPICLRILRIITKKPQPAGKFKPDIFKSHN
jgi:hypothetical protein